MPYRLATVHSLQTDDNNDNNSTVT